MCSLEKPGLQVEHLKEEYTKEKEALNQFWVLFLVCQCHAGFPPHNYSISEEYSFSNPSPLHPGRFATRLPPCNHPNENSCNSGI